MQGLIDLVACLNTNQGAIIAIATIALACTTYYYSRLVQRQLEAADTPEIALYLAMKGSKLHLGIVNVGTGIARDLQFETYFFDDGYLPGFMDGISYLEPGRPMRYFLHSIQERNDRFSISVTYRDSRKGKHKRIFYLNPIELDGAVGDDDRFWSSSPKLRTDKNNVYK